MAAQPAPSFQAPARSDDGAAQGGTGETKNEVLIFEEDIAAAEHHTISGKLQQRIDLIIDRPAGPRGTPLHEFLNPLFAIAGLNYVILDPALDAVPLSIRLEKVSIESALRTLSQLVHIRYNYSGGTVFLSLEAARSVR